MYVFPLHFCATAVASGDKHTSHVTLYNGHYMFVLRNTIIKGFLHSLKDRNPQHC